jgi:hypothetical protein
MWLFETRMVDMTNWDHSKDVWRRLREARMLGVPRSCIESVTPPDNVIAKMGLHWWLAFERWALPLHKSAIYAFMCYLLPSQEELASEKQDRPAPVSPALEQGELFA